PAGVPPSPDGARPAGDDRVRRHLPEFRLADPLADRDATLRDLLTHRTGLGSHDLLWYRAAWGLEEMVRRAGKLPPSYPFRAGFEDQSGMVGAAGVGAAPAGGAPGGGAGGRPRTRPRGVTGPAVTPGAGPARPG